MKTVSLIELHQYVMKQKNTRRIRLYAGFLDTKCKLRIPSCLLCHYGKYLGMKRILADFHQFHDPSMPEVISIEGGFYLHKLFTHGIIPLSGTYGELKERLVPIEKLHALYKKTREVAQR